MVNSAIIATIPTKVTLVAVTKTLPASSIQEAYRAGVRHFGENYVSEFAQKYANLPPEVRRNATFHMIGHVQSRKAKRVVELFDWVDSVDSIKLAGKLSAAAVAVNKTLRVLLEVNISGEGSKFGFDLVGWENDAEKFNGFFQNAQAIHVLPALQLCGFMTMPPYVRNPEDNRKIFRSLKNLSQTLRKKHPAFGPALSMGTSQDYMVAIEEGATMVRLGKAPFGPRQLQK